MGIEGQGEGTQGLGGARADFVASLGRKVADARKTLAALEGDPRSQNQRDELRRKVHALGTSARMMRFDVMAQALAEAEAALEAIDPTVPATLRNVTVVARTLDDLPALAWSDGRKADDAAATPAPPGTGDGRPSPARSNAPPMTVLIVGPDSIADTLLDDADAQGRSVECERTEDPQQAVGLARAIAPDVVVIDALVQSAAELVEALADDPLTEPVPVIVVGRLTSEAVARFIALGVARTLSAPYSGEALRSICDEAIDQREGRTMRISLGDPTIEQLGERLADEVRRAIVGAVDQQSRQKHVALGEGTEIMAAIWGAIARVRDVVTTRTGGAVRFASGGPEGTVALAFQPDMPGAERIRRGRGAAADVTLEGRRVIVADDDPGVTWFLSDLLRTTGCVVNEALDGETALELAMRASPDVIISDILMPKMDGFALSRAVKRDVALRDTPVILLSWKEDLLQRVRELGASAAAYLRKESDARSVLARVREVLWPRARVEARLKGTGEVRGRLDGLTVRTLLDFVATIRKDARISVRDASCLYEVEMREGIPRRATRTAGDGDFARGPKVLGEMLGISAGRFIVAPATPGPLQGELSGTLAEQLEKHIANARGAMAVVTGAHATDASRLELDPEILGHYLRATPEPARSLIARIAKGSSPRELLLEGKVVPSLLDDVLTDLAARGAVLAVTGESGADLLGPAVATALEIAHNSPARNRAPLTALRPSATPPPILGTGSSLPIVAEKPTAAERPVIVEKASDEDEARGPQFPESSVNISIQQLLQEEAQLVEERKKASPAPKKQAAPESSLSVSIQQLLDEEARLLAAGELPTEVKPLPTPSPSSLEDAVMRQLGDASPAPGKAHLSSPLPPPIVEPSALRPRSSNPPAGPQDSTDVEAIYEAQLATPSVPTLSERDVEETENEEPRPREQTAPLPLTRKATPVPAEAKAKAKTEPKSPSKSPPSKPASSAPASRTTAPSSPVAAPAPRPSGGGGLRWFLFGVLVLGAGWFVMRMTAPPAPQEPSAPGEVSIAVQYTDVPPGGTIAPNEGWLEIHAPEGAHVWVDGKDRTGAVGEAISAGPHDVRVDERQKTVEVQAGKAARVDWPP